MTRRQLGQRLLLAEHDREHLQRGDHAVAGRRVIEEDEVPGLLAAEVVAAAAHLFDDVAIADGGAHELAAARGERALEAHVAHDGRDERLLVQAPCA